MAKSGRYVAKYLVADSESAGALVAQMMSNYASSFGSGEDQWEGLYPSDPGFMVMAARTPKGMYQVTVIVPVSKVPRDYWLSPWCAEDGVETFAKDRQTEHGDPYEWGMLERNSDKKWRPS